jgi:hypothetical protein
LGRAILKTISKYLGKDPLLGRVQQYLMEALNPLLKSLYPQDMTWILLKPNPPFALFGQGYSDLGFKRLVTGQVALRGLLKTTVAVAKGATICTLPAVLAPRQTRTLSLQVISAATGSFGARIDVQPDGTVVLADVWGATFPLSVSYLGLEAVYTL